ncbi:hypothetical protein BDN67DRAFT_984717 [Paxillus ammoniavirescens]|nr:hypothetical protein BDN67DRAFT_984717 [Paxillus ammoniavirescens]
MAVCSRKLHAKDITCLQAHVLLEVHFVGVWDTVSSVGLAKEDVYLSSSSSAERACHFRHALALEERRVKFLSEYFHRMNAVTDHKWALSSQKQKSKYILDKELGVVEDQNLTATASDDEKLNGTRK